MPTPESGAPDLQSLFEYVSEATVGLDSTRRIVIWNIAASEMFGYSAREMLGDTADRLIPQAGEGDHSEMIDNFASGHLDRSLMGGGMGRDAVRRSGEVFPIQVSLGRFDLASGQLLMATVRDMSAASGAGQRTQLEREWFEVLITDSFDTASLLDADGRFVYVHAASDGHGHEALVGTAKRDWIHPEDLWLWDETMARVIDEGTGSVATVTTRHRFPEGYRWMEVRLVNLIGHAPVNAIVTNGRNVSDRMQTETERRVEHQWFEALVRNSFDGIAVLATDGTSAYAVPLDTRRPDTSSLGRGVRDWCHPDDTQEFLDTLATVASGGLGATAKLTSRSHFPDGYRWIESRLTNLLDDPVVNGIVNNYRDITERHAFEEKLLHDATHDPLTGLPNRALLADRVDHALARTSRRGGSVALMFLDLDDFKAVNDTSGHEAGDQLLCTIAGRLTSVVREIDTVSRHGGDEFVVLAEDDVDRDVAFTMAERIRETLGAPARIGGRTITPTVSIGIAMATNGDTDGETLLANADTAMYQAKRSGRNRTEVFDVASNDRDHLDTLVESSLAGALDRGELQLGYRSARDIATDNIRHVEAVTRWQHPASGLLDYDEFISLAENLELVGEIELWAIENAVHQGLRWQRDVGVRIDIATRVSARHLTGIGACDQIVALLDNAGLEPSRLCLEMAELDFMEHRIAAEVGIQALSRAGIRTALIHYGKGDSSPSRLEALPIEYVKIDRSLTDRIGADGSGATIVRSIIDIAHAFDLEALADGVADSARLSTLRSLGCDAAQGDFIGPLGPSDALGQRLTAAANNR